MIYFIQSEKGPIKIGHTQRSVKSRFSSLQSSSSEALTLLGSMSGDLNSETAIHRKFSEDLIRGEWFNPSKRLMAFIKANSTGQMDGIVGESDSFEQEIANAVRKLRLSKNIDRETLANQAGVSHSSLRHLESGTGASVRTLVKVVKALNRQDWLLGLAPQISINPLHMVRGKPRQRAQRRQK